MFLVKQFMDKAVDVNYPIEEATNRLEEATYFQLVECKSRILDDAWEMKYVTAQARRHIYELCQAIDDAMSFRNQLVNNFSEE